MEAKAKISGLGANTKIISMLAIIINIKIAKIIASFLMVSDKSSNISFFYHNYNI